MTSRGEDKQIELYKSRPPVQNNKDSVIGALDNIDLKPTKKGGYKSVYIDEQSEEDSIREHVRLVYPGSGA